MDKDDLKAFALIVAIIIGIYATLRGLQIVHDGIGDGDGGVSDAS